MQRGQAEVALAAQLVFLPLTERTRADRVCLQLRASLTAAGVLSMPPGPEKIAHLARMFTDLVELARRLAAANIKMQDAKPDNIGLFSDGAWSVFDFGCFHRKGKVYMETQIGQLKHCWESRAFWRPEEEGVRQRLNAWLDEVAAEAPVRPLRECLFAAAGFVG